MPPPEPSPIVLTIGHSTRTLEEFICLLQAHGATRVVDVRTVPRSLRNPQFNKTSLPESLKKAGLGYVHMPGLGACAMRHAILSTRDGEMHPSEAMQITCRRRNLIRVSKN
jgi:uncharacterized protein (DUF488 family)